MELLEAPSSVGDQQLVGVSHQGFTTRRRFTCLLSTQTAEQKTEPALALALMSETRTFVKLMEDLTGVGSGTLGSQLGAHFVPPPNVQVDVS